MLSRRNCLIGLAGCILVFAVAGCQAFPLGGGTPKASAGPTAVVSTTESVLNSVVWARIPFCSCLDGIATDNVSAALKRAQLAGTVKLLNPTNGWMYFVVAFDPATASRDQIATAIAAGGGQVLAGPP